MKILHLSKIESCAEAQDAYDIYFTNPISEKYIANFSKLGKIVYTDINSKKLFRVIVKGKYTIKGFIDNDNLRVLFANSNHQNFLQELKDYISNTSDH